VAYILGVEEEDVSIWLVDKNKKYYCILGAAMLTIVTKLFAG
jgi:hypothetical protein